MAPRGFNRYMVAIGMGTHPKFARLTDSEFRAHVVGVLAIAAMSPVRGRLLVGETPAEPIDVAVAAGVPVRVASATLQKLLAVGVLRADEDHNCLRVHDWDDLNPTPGATRSQRWRDGQRDVSVTDQRHVNGSKTSPEVEVEVEVKKTPTSTPSTSPTLTADVEARDDR